MTCTMECRITEAVHSTARPKATFKKSIPSIRYNKPHSKKYSTSSGIHMMKNSSSDRQQHGSNSRQAAAEMHDRYIQIHTRTPYSSVQQHNIKIHISGSGTLCCETTHTRAVVPSKKYEKKTLAVHKKQKSGSSSGNRTYDLTTFSRSASYLLTTRSLLPPHTAANKKKKPITPHCTDRNAPQS